MSTKKIEELWRQYLKTYAAPEIRDELQSRFGDDPNVVGNLIQYDWPPTFQPGYIGPGFMKKDRRVVFIWQNPGEGGAAEAKHDKILAAKLQAFANRDISLDELRQFQAGHIKKWWPFYREKGILKEWGESTIALLPKEERPSISSIAHLTAFPLKTTDNEAPLDGTVMRHMWECLIMPTIEALTPSIIVHTPFSDRLIKAHRSQLERLKPSPEIVRVWLPGEYNVNAQRPKLEQSWEPLAELLCATT